MLATSEVFTADMEETYRLLDVSPSEVTTLDSYLQDYFTSILKKLKEVGATSRQTDFYGTCTWQEIAAGSAFNPCAFTV